MSAPVVALISLPLFLGPPRTQLGGLHRPESRARHALWRILQAPLLGGSPCTVVGLRVALRSAARQWADYWARPPKCCASAGAFHHPDCLARPLCVYVASRGCHVKRLASWQP